MKAPSRNSIFLPSNRVRILLTVLALAVLLGGAGEAQAGLISIKLTSDALGLGSSDINKGKTVDIDVLDKLITSPNTGEGSILTIQTDGLAGPGTVANPLFVTVRAKTHLDTVNYPLSFGGDPRDYQAGVLFISKESDKTPDGKDEGLGVRAFKLDVATGLREFGDGSGLALIEGSKDVSGGTGHDAYDLFKPNGPPHVDDSVTFDFARQFYANALSVEVLLNKFDPTDIIDLHIELTSRPDIYLEFLQTTDTNIFEQVGTDKDKLWKLKFSGIDDLLTGDLIDNFTIFANDDEPLHPRGTAEHFLITGMTVDTVPEPSTIMLLGLGGLLLRRRKK